MGWVGWVRVIHTDEDDTRAQATATDKSRGKVMAAVDMVGVGVMGWIGVVTRIVVLTQGQGQGWGQGQG